MFRPFVILIVLSLIAVNVGSHSHASRDAEPSAARPQSPPAAPRRRALLVGVSNYCRDGSGAQCGSQGKYWWDLNSGNDVDAVGEVLISDKFGFKKEEIKTLKTTEETTHESIVRTFKSFLVEQTGPGDIVYFHFSGHGSQVEDDRSERNPKLGDELDGKDETLVPSDYAGLRDGQNDIRDDEIEQLLAGLAGRHVTMTVDSCHSGTITRGGRSLARGMRLTRAVAPNPRGAQDGPSGLFAANAALPRSLVVISAARNDQGAFETVDDESRTKMGAFTASLLGAFKNAGDETTYRDLFERINAEFTRKHGNQDPQLEGSRDNVLFSGVVRPPQPYINVEVRDGKVLLKAGSLQGMTAGSRFSVYPPGKDSKTGSPVARAEITAVGPTASVLKLTPEPDEKALKGLKATRAVETFHNFGDMRLKVVFEDTARSALGAAMMNELKSLSLLNVPERAEDWNVRVCRGRCQNERPAPGQEDFGRGGVLTLIREDGSVIERVADGPKMTDAFRNVLEGEARWRFVKALDNENDPNLQIRMRLVPVTKIVRHPVTGLAASATDLAPEVQPSEGNRLVLHDGDTVMLEVMNLGTADAFVSVLDLRSNGEIGPLFPHPDIPPGNANENKIPVRNDLRGNPVWQRIPCPFVIRINKPYGREVFKAIVTRSAADFSPLFRPKDAGELQTGQTRGTSRGEREAKSPLGQIFLTATTGRTRGKTRTGTRGDPPGGDNKGQYGAEDAAHLGAPTEDWATAEITFEALPPGKITPYGGPAPEMRRPVTRPHLSPGSRKYVPRP